MSRVVATDVLVEGRGGSGDALVLTAPISFWGGVDPRSGRITDIRHPQHGECVAGTVLCLPGTIGSSSASAVLLELVSAGKAPAALVLHEADAILLLGLVVAREMGLTTPIAVRLDAEAYHAFSGCRLSVAEDGGIGLENQTSQARNAQTAPTTTIKASPRS